MKHLAHGLVQVERLEDGLLGARETEKRTGDAGRPARLGLDLFQHGPFPVTALALEEELRVARDPRQRRVDLVRNAGGQQPD